MDRQEELLALVEEQYDDMLCGPTQFPESFVVLSLDKRIGEDGLTLKDVLQEDGTFADSY